MSDDGVDHRAFYEEEARRGLRTPPAGFRVDIRARYVRSLLERGCGTVVDLGSGPAGDGGAFVEAGLGYVGLDLAVGNARLAARSGLVVVPGSLTAPPFRPGSFDAGWSMSTLMHLTEAETSAALAAISALLRPSSPFLVGLWGGTLGDVVGDWAIPDRRRRFSLRSLGRNQELLASIGRVERADVHDAGPDGWEYQVFELRVP